MGWDSLLQEHMNGWLLYVNDRLVADLIPKGSDDPFHLFEVRMLTGDETDLRVLASTSRPVSASIYYKNKKTGVVVPDVEFVTNFYNAPPDYTIIALRDFIAP